MLIMKTLKQLDLPLYCRILLKSPDLQDEVPIRTVLADHGLNQALRTLSSSTLDPLVILLFAVSCVRLVEDEDETAMAEAYAKGMLSKKEFLSYAERLPAAGCSSYSRTLCVHSNPTIAVRMLLAEKPELEAQITTLLEQIL